MRGLILAVQFLTRLPTPALKDFRAEQLAGAIVWFPLVGLLLGGLVAGAAWLGGRVDPWLGALLALAVWVGVTGALHLDGLADLADARGGHRLLVTHAGVMRALLMDLVGLDPAHAYRIALPETAHFQVSILAGEAPVLLNLNSCAD